MEQIPYKARLIEQKKNQARIKYLILLMKILIYTVSHIKDKNQFYVGSTKQTLNARMKNHRFNCQDEKYIGYNSKFYKYMRENGVENFEIKLYKELDVIDVDKKREAEQEVINILDPPLNTRNAKNPLTEEQKKERANYLRSLRKEKIEAYHKPYRKARYESKKDEILAKQKDYNKKKKERMQNDQVYAEEVRKKNREKTKKWREKNKKETNNS